MPGAFALYVPRDNYEQQKIVRTGVAGPADYNIKHSTMREKFYMGEWWD